MSRRQALVEAAFARIASGGLEGLRLRQVAGDVGIDHSTLHHHFATKQDLLLDVAAYTTRQFWTDAFDRPDPAQALRAHLAEIAARTTDWPELFVVISELDLRALRDPAMREALRQLEAGWRERLRALFVRGIADGTWRAIDPDVACELVIATAKGLRHVPRHAGAVFGQLEALLEGDPT